MTDPDPLPASALLSSSAPLASSAAGHISAPRTASTPLPASAALPASAVGPREAVERLAGDGRVCLIGVRHHSPVLAAAVSGVLDAYQPGALLVELPAEMQSWVDWLAHPDTRAPVALAAGGNGQIAFYPFADFSPELAALRWARRAGVPVVCCDLPLTDPAWRWQRDGEPERAGLGAAIHATLSGRGDDDLWDRWIEAGAPGSSPEAVRRAALAAGWALRHDAEATGVDPLDLRREAWMRDRIAATPGRIAVIVGAFHAPALLENSLPPAGCAPTSTGEDASAGGGGDGPVVSLVPYTFELLDARSGYPAGIRDPRWQQAVHECGADPGKIRAASRAFAVEVTRELRAQGRPAGPGEAAEAARLADDLAALRQLPAPGRGELVEALQTVLAQGSPAGAGRTVARAMQTVLVGRDRGRLPAGAPTTGLRPAVERELDRLRLPGPGARGERMRLDPLRSPTDRARELVIRRLDACGVPYGRPGTPFTPGSGGMPGSPGTPGSGGGPVAGGGALTSTWQAEWTPGTDAAIAVAALHGVTLSQAAEGMLLTRRRRELHDGGPTAEQALIGLEQAAACGLAGLAGRRVGDVREMVGQSGTVAQIVTGLQLLRRIERGHIPGLAPAPGSARDGHGNAELPGNEFLEIVGDARDALHAAAVAAVAGLAGSTRVEDARALHDLVRAADEDGRVLRLDHTVRGLARDGSPLMRGAAAAVGVLLGHETPGGFGGRLASWLALDGAEATDRLRGALSVAGTLLQAGGEFLDPLLDRVERLPDDEFVRRLPGLRGGFDALSPADRDRLLRTITERHGTVDARLATDATTAAAWLTADRAGLAALRALGLDTPPAGRDSPRSRAEPEPSRQSESPGKPGSSAQPDTAHEAGASPNDGAASANGETAGGTPTGSETARGGTAGGTPTGSETARGETAGGTPTGGETAEVAADERAITGVERWRLLLGREAEQLPADRRRLATALDELYGAGRGEGAYTVDGGGGGGRQAAYPQIRDWLEDLEDFFGTDVRDEVIARAAERGRLDAVLAAEPERVRPSIDLLHAVLALAGGLPEARLARLRPLVARLTAELTAQLARRIQPALTGIGTPRPTRRPTGRLDLAATVRRNLHTARRDADGQVRVVPEQPVFRTLGRRTVDWQVILLVDVSGSMEESTIWAALTASVLAGVPALRTHFVTFSTQVTDLTDRVTDPLSLLLEIQVGGGTHIAAGLRYARQITIVPARTLVVTISDFEEGFPTGDLLAAARALVDDGVTLLGCASLDDRGSPRYSTGVAGQLAGAGMPVAALSPSELARWIGEKVR